jgi:hypothetical protein
LSATAASRWPEIGRSRRAMRHISDDGRRRRRSTVVEHVVCCQRPASRPAIRQSLRHALSGRLGTWHKSKFHWSPRMLHISTVAWCMRIQRQIEIATLIGWCAPAKQADGNTAAAHGGNDWTCLSSTRFRRGEEETLCRHIRPDARTSEDKSLGPGVRS